MEIKFETINGQLCRMVEPEPLTEFSHVPCVIRRKQGVLTDILTEYSTNPTMSILGELFEIIGYPVETGSAEWAWYQGCVLGNQIWNDRIKELVTIYPCHSHDIQTNVIIGQPMKHWKDNYDGWLDQCKQYAMLTGWQLYKPEPEPAYAVWDCKIEFIRQELKNLLDKI